MKQPLESPRRLGPLGAGIYCVVCGARPYPELGPPETREDFDLMRVDRKGHPAESSSLRRVVLFAAFRAHGPPRLSGHGRMGMAGGRACTERGHVMIGPLNRVPGAHAPQIETSLAFTAPGQATWADPTIPHTCGECAHWTTLKARAKIVVAAANTSRACRVAAANRSKNDSRLAARSISLKRGLRDGRARE